VSRAAEAMPDEGLGALGRDVADDAIRLVRAEIDLAKAQAKEAAKRLILAVVLLVMAATLLLIGVIEALGGAPAAFSQRLFGNGWLGWVALGGLLMVVGVFLALFGTLAVRQSLREGKRTVGAFKEDTEWLKGLTRRGNSGS
jgi:Putative Actinobacterial Holin-X, holin superfamily III